MKILGLIPARGGSRGVPRKNARLMAGKSLVRRAFECAAASGVVDRIIISTDDEEIASDARSVGIDVPFMRPAPLAGDTTPMLDVVVHALKTLADEGYHPDAVMLLQPTSPLRKSEHLRKAAGLLDGHDSVCSVTPVPSELCPHFVMKIDSDGRLRPFMPDGPRYTRRQDVPPAYRREGTVYLVRADVVLEQNSLYGNDCVPMLLDPADSISIDTPEQWSEAEQRLSADA